MNTRKNGTRKRLKDHHMPKQSLGDVMDKVSILTRKVYFGEEDAFKELTYLCESVDRIDIPLSGALLAAIIRLTQMNFEIWNRENELRKGGEGKFTHEEIAKRAIEIRDHNRKRVRYKNEINRLTGLGYREFKIKHRSQ